MKASDRLKQAAAMKAYDFVEKDPEQNIPKLMDNDNMLRPCPVLDNPGKLTEMVELSGAHSTDVMEPESACDYCRKCEDKAAKWAPVAQRLWDESGKAKK